jgi:hypothetical protein
VPEHIHAMTGHERGPVRNPFLTAHKRGWWDSVGEDVLASDALVYVELEDEAITVRTFEIDLVDGLMQTPEYAAAVIHANQPSAPDELVRRQVDVRTRRQARLRGTNPLRVTAIVTEGALRVQVGGAGTMRRQLEHLLALMELPNVELGVVPATGAYPAMGTPFHILSFGSRFPDVGHVELLDRGVYLEEPDDVRPYAMKFASLRAAALGPERSRELIATIAGQR